MQGISEPYPVDYWCEAMRDATVEETQTDFRRENAAKEVILRQQRTDRETRAALKVLEGGKRTPVISDGLKCF